MEMIGTLTRAVINNNPLNIDFVQSIVWDGQLPNHWRTDSRFYQFVMPHFGIRAGIKNFQFGIDKEGHKTWADLIRRQAPPKSAAPADNNDTQAYIASVGKYAAGRIPNMDAPALVHQWWPIRAFTEGCILVETGGAIYPEDVWSWVQHNLGMDSVST